MAPLKQLGMNTWPYSMNNKVDRTFGKIKVGQKIKNLYCMCTALCSANILSIIDVLNVLTTSSTQETFMEIAKAFAIGFQENIA